VTTRVESKSVRMMVLYRLRVENRLRGISDSELGEAFAVRRETIWRDRQALAVADQLYDQVAAKLSWNDTYTVAEAAEKLKCTEETLEYMIRAGILQADDWGADHYHRYLIPLSEIRRLQR
jgi:hypothetical protein